MGEASGPELDEAATEVTREAVEAGLLVALALDEPNTREYAALAPCGLSDGVVPSPPSSG